MANTNSLYSELLLQLIADELYAARLDRESEGVADTVWLKGGGREEWVEDMKKLRDRIDKLPDL